MSVITKITQQVKKQHRYSVFIDGKFSFSLNEMEIAASGLHVGRELSEAELNGWLKQSDSSKGIEKVYNFLSYRARSRREIADYLRRKGYEPDTAAQIIGQFESEGLINDAQFAEDWSKNRQLIQHRSRRELKSELIKKGIEKETIETSIAELPDEVETIVSLIHSKNLLKKYDDEKRLMAYLAGKGFNYGDIKTALRRFSEG